MNPFTTDGGQRATDNPLTLTVPELVELLPQGVDGLEAVTVCGDGHLVAQVWTGNREKIVVTAWTGEGQGSRHGRPEKWRQNYHREFTDAGAAERRYDALLAKHGGAAGGAA